MSTLIDTIALLDLYSIASFGAALVGFGLMSGLLLVRRQGSQFSRPYFMSAFGMAILVFFLAAVERSWLAGGGAALKALAFLITVAYGVALVRRAWRRPLANRPLGTFVIVCVICCGLPSAPGVIGAVVAREYLLDAVTASVAATRDQIGPYSLQIFLPLGAAAVGTAFLTASFLLLLFRKAAGR